ncbi:LPS-assembly protein LptD [Subsaximicrobium wynnwilliamsii]|uniref:LPS-assembly protein LptD n=1 Tax=Subsaximicrobium wynnwilliamsii TaxID=291179 RepID=A0A5C6ZL65_9FLAO|nr:putative LPS assembly protein LptD [Subsaximicrobium wynnwilliamsii]TXD85045.1 LPS-assembly protein LptD [Subsaximicrobium wynnwilliamsii]TXD91088.1 LPS-assembly protein LptD [Subsaximicrobium wynnwilliamsii]TXE04482.1 LPS-assembly protein LptD [Subsaximicrobium wynnwilliamsii]
MAIQIPSHTLAKIHLKALHTKSFPILFSLSFTVFINMFCFAQDLPITRKPIKPVSELNDTLRLAIDTLTLPATRPIKLTENDSIKNDTLPKQKETLTAIVNYKATDFVRLNQKLNQTTLYNEAKVDYGDMNITAGIIVIDHSSKTVYAGRIKDSAGVYTQKPVFTQGPNIIEPDSIIFNTDTKKALIFNSKTEQSGGTIVAEVTKRENDSVLFMKNAIYTTAENLDDPEYYFKMRKAKVVPGKKVVTGLTNLFIYDVPTPIGLPFAYFPMSKDQTSGVIIPTPGQDLGSSDRGYNLQNGGYYFAISEYFDLAVLGDYFTNGSYGLRLENSYALRYRFRGNLSIRYENLINSERGFPDFSKSTIYNIRWSHTQDAKANPNSRFSASVNLGSSRYFQQSINQNNLAQTQNNTLASSVSYSKTFPGEPQVNMNVTATHSQNTNTQDINLTLPTFQGSVSRIFPFAPSVGTKKGIIQNINLQYNVRAENRINTNDSVFFKSEMFDDAKIGAVHSVPVSTNFKVFKYFSMSANANFEENWTYNTINKFQDEEGDIITEDLNGFDRFLTYNFSTSIGTTIYGLFDFEKEGRDPKIQKIRHVMRPSISYNINPAFDQYYDTFEVVDANGTTVGDMRREEYTRFQGSLFGTPGNNFSSAMRLSVGNNFEAKVRSNDSTATEPEKIKLLDNLNFETSYNFAGDSLKISAVRVSGGTTILDNKMNINFGAILDPYALDNNNQKIDKFNINNGGSLFRLTSANFNVSYSITSDSFDREPEDDRGRDESLRSGGRDDDLFGTTQDFADQRLSDDDDDEEEEISEFYNFSIPWKLRLAYAATYSNAARQNTISNNSLMFSGDVELSPRWSVGVSSGYDFVNKGFTQTQFRFERDLLSWRMNFSYVPFGPYSQWNFFIGISSSMLQDLKYDKRRQPDQRL